MKKEDIEDMNTPISSPESISRFKKERFLLSMTEDVFRDTVVRPLFLRQGLQDGRDLCGPSEKGKDAVFVSVDQLGIESLYVIQTKKGPLTMSRRVSDNLIEAITQLNTAIHTKVPLVEKHKKALPCKVFLCCSGKINENARQHIVEEVADSRICFLDADDLIPRIDKVYPELWLGIDAEMFPYFKAIKRLVESPSDGAFATDVLPAGAAIDAATDKMFVPLRLHRMYFKIQRRSGQAFQVPAFDNLPVTGITNRLERLVLIIGDAGSGKSTSIKRIAYVLADKAMSIDAKFKVPILIRATEVWSNNNRPFVDICVESTMRLMNSTKPSFSNDDLKEGRIVVLLDALDELADDNARKAVVEHALIFHKENPKCQIVITSRDYDFLNKSDAIKNFTRFNLTPIDYKQAQQIIKRFESKRGLSPEKSNEILRRLQDVHGMELNPLLVTVFAATSDYARRDIPANITELFKKYTEWMLGRWDSNKGLGQQYHAPLKDFLLKNTAFEMHRRRLTSIDLLEFKEAIRTELENRGRQADFEQLYDEILNRSGLFRIVGGRVEFRHHLLQEFFAGRGIQSEEMLKAIISDQWWQRAIVFYFGENPDKADIFGQIITSLSVRTNAEIYSSALTLGLALQACYLVKTQEKKKILPWIIETIAKTQNDFVASTDTDGKYPLSRFLTYYITSRDSVACDTLGLELNSIRESLCRDNLTQDEKDDREFWVIVGLLESGEMVKAQEAIVHFKPVKAHFLLAIHMGCFLTQHLKIATKDEKKISVEIMELVAPRIVHLRSQFMQEFKSELIEFRKGELKTIEFPPQESSNKDE